VIKSLMQFSTDHLLKFVACGLTQHIADMAPNLCNRLWLELDIVPMIFPVRTINKPLRPLSRPPPTGQESSALKTAEGTLKTATETLKTVTESLKTATIGGTGEKDESTEGGTPRPVDEQSDSAVRKCVMYFGPTHNPRLSIGYRNEVEVDAAGKIHILDGLEFYPRRRGTRRGTRFCTLQRT